MTSVALKKDIIKKITETNDKNVLADVYKLLQIQEDVEDVYIVTPEQKKAIKAAQNQIKKGLGIPSEQANKEIREWLKK